METFTLLFAHNAWANQRIFDSCQSAPGDFLGPAASGFAEVETHMQRLQHLVWVERGFVDAIVSDAKMDEPPTTLPDIVAYATETAARFAALCSPLDEADLEREFFVPWWERNFSVRDGLIQTLGHSAQHRAEVAWELAKVGVDTGNLDYIVWTASGRPKASDPWPPPDSAKT